EEISKLLGRDVDEVKSKAKELADEATWDGSNEGPASIGRVHRAGRQLDVKRAASLVRKLVGEWKLAGIILRRKTSTPINRPGVQVGTAARERRFPNAAASCRTRFV